MSGFEVTIGDMDLLRQVFDRQESHMNAIKDYVSSHCTTPGGFGVVLQPLQGHYERAYDDGVTGLGSGATVAQACSTKISETKDALLETDRKQYERYAQQEAALGHDVPPYTPPAGGGTLPGANSGYTPEGEDGGYPSLDDPYKFLASKGYDALDAAQRAGHTPEHAAPGAPDEPGSDTHPGGDHRADGSTPDTDASSNGSSGGSSDSGSDSGSSDSGSSDGSSSSSGSSDGDSSGPQHSSGAGRHEAKDGPNVIDKATDIYNAPGDYLETGQDLAETAGTSQDLGEAENGPVNDDQTDWANSGGSSW